MSVRRRVGTKRKTAPENVTFAPETETKRKKPETEKRLRRYRSSMTIGIYDRIERALNQRLYLLATSKSSTSSLSREYQVLGQTGNVYTVVISHLPSCTCKFLLNIRSLETNSSFISRSGLRKRSSM